MGMRGGGVAIAGVLALPAGCRPASRVPTGSDGEPASAAGATTAPAFLPGALRVETSCNDDSTGRVHEPLGPAPADHLMHSPACQRSVHLMRTPALAPLARSDEHPTHAGRRQLPDASLTRGGGRRTRSFRLLVLQRPLAGPAGAR